jgi:hypothetical protein
MARSCYTVANNGQRQAMRVMTFAGAGIVIALLLAVAAPQLFYPLWFDQGAFAACADALRHGGVMYRDCWEVRGPAIALVYMIPMSLSSSPVAIHLFDLLWQAATAVVLGLLARRLYGVRAAIVTSVLYWLMYASINYWATAQAESFANLFFMLNLYAALRAGDGVRATAAVADSAPGAVAQASQRHQPRLSHGTWLVISGACIGILFWFKYPFFLFGLAPLLLVLFRKPPAPGSTRRSQSLLLLGGSFLAMILLGLAYFALNGALGDLQRQIAYDIATFNNVPLGSRLLWFRTIFAEEIVAFVSRGNTPTADFKDTATQLTILGRGYPYVFILVTIGLLLGGWQRSRRAATLVGLGYLALTMAINLWQGHFYRYHFLIALPPMALLAGASMMRLDWRSRPAPLISTLALLAPVLVFSAAVAGLSATMLPWMRDAFDNAIVQRKPIEAQYMESKLAPYSSLARALNRDTQPDDRIVVFSDVPAIYPLAKRLNGTRFPYLRWAQESGSVEVREEYVQEFLDDMQRTQPKFFVLTQPGFPWEQEDFISLWKSMPDIHQYVEAHYHYVGEHGPFLLFLRNVP